MKRCPTCDRTYPDDAQGFCPNDGSPLAVELPPTPSHPQAPSPPPAQTPPAPAPAQAPQGYGQNQRQGAPREQAAKVRGGWAWAIPSLLISLVCFLAAMILFIFREGFSHETRYAEDSNFPPVVIGLILLLLLPMLAFLLGGVGLFRAKRVAGRAVAAAGALFAVFALLFALPVHYWYWTTPLGGWRQGAYHSPAGSRDYNSNSTGSGYNTNSGSSVATSGATPAEVWKSFYAAAQRNDVAAVKRMMSRELLARAAQDGKGHTVDEMISDELQRFTHSFTSETRGVFINGDNAIIEVRDVSLPGEHWTKIPFVKEDGAWKLTR